MVFSDSPMGNLLRQYNDVGDIVDNVLGLGGAPKSFADKMDRLRGMTESHRSMFSAVSRRGNKLNLERPLVIFDLETTGFHVKKGDSIFEAAFLKIFPSGKVEEQVFQINPERELSSGAAKTTGKTSAQINTPKWGRSFLEESKGILGFLKGSDLAGYNVSSFDIPFLESQLGRVGISSNLLKHSSAIDVLGLVRSTNLAPVGSRGLGEVFKQITGGALEGAHTALADVRATGDILTHLLQNYDLPNTAGSLATASNITLPSSSHYTDLMRMDRTPSNLIGSIQASTPTQLRGMFSNLSRAGLLPESAQAIFENVSAHGGSMFYNEGARALYYGTGENWSALPLAGAEGSVSIGGRSRKVNQLLREYDTGFQTTSFIDQYYQDLSGRMQPQIGSIHAASRDVRRSDLSRLLMEGPDTRGVFTPEEAFWTSNRGALQPSDTNIENRKYFDSLRKYNIATSARSQLIKSAGRSVSDPLKELAQSTHLTTKEAFSFINKLSDEYTEQLGQLLTRAGSPSSYVYTKPEYLGSGSKVLLSGPAMGEMYGTLFEKHILQKGMYQLAKLKRGTPGDPVTPYLLKGTSGDIHRSMLLNVAIVDTQNQAISKLLFQEGGSLLTPLGESALSFQAPVGNIKFSSPSEELIGAVERLYGVNMGAGGYVQTPGTGPNFSSADYRAAMRGGPDLTDIQKDIRFVSGSSQKYKGILEIAAVDQAVLGKIQLTDSSLKLDFLSKGDVLPEASELVTGARRNTGVVPGGSNPLRGVLDELGTRGVHKVMAADEFKKMHGPGVFLANFIRQVQGIDNAEAIFEEAFGYRPHLATTTKIPTAIPWITNHDQAFQKSLEMVEDWTNHGSAQQRRLASTIQHGTKVVLDGFTRLGIKGIRVFGMEVGRRTDFMGDINMMKAVGISPGKMMTIASGSRGLGYASQSDNPLYNALMSRNKMWREGLIGTRVGSGSLFLSEAHPMRRFATAFAGGTEMPAPPPGQIITMKDGGLFRGADKLDDLPGMDAFRRHAGGVSFDDLKNTILGKNMGADMLYLDMGTTRSLDLLGTGARDYRYLPVPLAYLRGAQKGPHDKLILSKQTPAYNFVKALIEMQNYPDASFEKGLQAGYASIFRSLGGREGLLNKSNTILMGMGTRARLIPQMGDDFGMKAWDSTKGLYDGFMTKGSFEDYLTRKGGEYPEEVGRLRKQVEKRGFYYSALTIDPMQRAEQAEIYKIWVKPGKSPRLGQLNISLHPHSFLRWLRDTDRDTSSMIPLSDSRHGSQKAMELGYEDMMERQKKLMAHSLWFDKYESMKAQVSSEGRLGNLGKKIEFLDPLKYLPEYMGNPGTVLSSLGYSTVRSFDQIMTNVATYGAEGAAEMGILSKNITADMVNQIAAHYKANPEELSMVQRSMSQFYQGAIQKGESRVGIIEAPERLIEIGQKYSGVNFDLKAATEESTEVMRSYLTEMKMGMFSEMGYLVEKDHTLLYSKMDFLASQGTLPSEGVALMKADLQRGLTETLDQATVNRMTLFTKEIINAQSSMMGRYVASGMILASSVQRAPKSAIDMIRTFMSDDTSPGAKGAAQKLQDMIEPLSSVKYSAPRSGDIFPGDGSLATDVAEELKEGRAKVASEGDSIFKKFKTFFGSTKGRTFGLGVAAGAVIGAGIHAAASGPDVPMPRQIDSRQPTDVGPTVFSSSPKIYGTNQNFYASQRRSPETFSSLGSYNFPGSTDSSVTIRDKRAPNSAYLLSNQMRQISNSDYNY